MQNKFDQDFIISHAIINYAHAVYQGEFAANEILQKFCHPDGSADKRKTLQEILTRITEWLSGLWRGDCLFSSTWSAPETFEASKSITYLKEAQQLCIQAAENCAILVRRSLSSTLTAQQFQTLVALGARCTYSRNYYVRGLVDAAHFLKYKEGLIQNALSLETASTEMLLIDKLVEASVHRGEFTEEEQKFLLQEALKYPGVLLSEVHDIAQLTARYEGGFNFARAGFNLEEAKAWYELGFGPVDAGYWRAYSFAPQEAKQWCAFGISIPVVADRWRQFEFDPQTASHWHNNKFDPIQARSWVKGGFSVEQASSYAARGITSPDKLPQVE